MIDNENEKNLHIFIFHSLISKWTHFLKPWLMSLEKSPVIRHIEKVELEVGFDGWFGPNFGNF